MANNFTGVIFVWVLLRSEDTDFYLLIDDHLSESVSVLSLSTC